MYTSQDDDDNAKDWVSKALPITKSVLNTINQTLPFIPGLNLLTPRSYKLLANKYEGNTEYTEVPCGSLIIYSNPLMTGNGIKSLRSVLQDPVLFNDSNIRNAIQDMVKQENIGGYKFKISASGHIDKSNASRPASSHVGALVNVLGKNAPYGKDINKIDISLGRSDPQAVKAALLIAYEIARSNTRPYGFNFTNWSQDPNRSEALKNVLSRVKINPTNDQIVISRDLSRSGYLTDLPTRPTIQPQTYTQNRLPAQSVAGSSTGSRFAPRPFSESGRPVPQYRSQVGDSEVGLDARFWRSTTQGHPSSIQPSSSSRGTALPPSYQSNWSAQQETPEQREIRELNARIAQLELTQRSPVAGASRLGDWMQRQSAFATPPPSEYAPSRYTDQLSNDGTEISDNRSLPSQAPSYHTNDPNVGVEAGGQRVLPGRRAPSVLSGTSSGRTSLPEYASQESQPPPSFTTNPPPSRNSRGRGQARR